MVSQVGDRSGRDGDGVLLLLSNSFATTLLGRGRGMLLCAPLNERTYRMGTIRYNELKTM